MRSFLEAQLQELKILDALAMLEAEIDTLKETSNIMEIKIEGEVSVFQAECNKVLSELRLALTKSIGMFEKTYEILEEKLAEFITDIDGEVEDRAREWVSYEDGLDIALDAIEAQASSEGFLESYLLKGYREALALSDRQNFNNCISREEFVYKAKRNFFIRQKEYGVSDRLEEIKELKRKTLSFPIIRKVVADG